MTKIVRIIYCSDLHGIKSSYEKLLKKAEDEKTDAIVIGGDLAPKGGMGINERIKTQRDFFRDFMFPLFKEFKSKNKDKEIYLIMGNDDYRANMDLLEKAEKGKIIKSMHGKSIKFGDDFNIAGYSFVNTTPFRLKDWEKPDFKGEDGQKQLFGEEIRSVKKESGTIDADIKKLKKLSQPKNTIYMIHAPPFKTKLDIIFDGTHVGSKAVREFIEKEQPPLTLHGHIHESPRMSGSWKDTLGNSVCINVGSSFPKDILNLAIIDTKNLDKISYFEI